MMTLFGCSKDAVVLSPEPFGDGYFQVKIGSKWNYRVDSFASPTNSIQRKYVWHVKDEVVDSFDNYNERHYVIERYKGDSTNSNFKFWHSFEYITSATKLSRIVGGDTLILMKWPTSKNNSWPNNTPTGFSTVTETYDSIKILDNIHYNEYSIEHHWRFTFDLNNIHRINMVEKAGIGTEFNQRQYRNRFGSGYRHYNHWKLIDFEY